MFVRAKSATNSSHKYIQILKSYRVGKKVKQKIVCQVGIATDSLEEQKLTKLAEEIIIKLAPRRPMQADLFDENVLPIPKLGRPSKKRLEDIVPPEQVTLTQIIEKQRIIEGIDEIGTKIYSELGYLALFENSNENILLKDLVLTRLASAVSKHKIRSILEEDYGKSYSMDAIYRIMDKVYKVIDEIKKLTFNKTLSLFKQGIDVLLFDVTTLYFESTNTDELREFGYSKDHRFNTTQVVLALATNAEGLPIGYELFEGNRAEVTTLISAIEKWRCLFSIGSVCFVGDRAMFSEKNIKLLEENNFQYVVAAKLRQLPQKLKNQILDEKNYRIATLKDEEARIAEFDYKESRLIVSYKASRAERDHEKRQCILDKIHKTLGAAKGETKRAITNQGIKKFTSTDVNSQTIIDQDKIESDTQWDGLHGVITNIKDASAKAILARYSNLWVIEDAFRLNKNLLKMRPIYHWKSKRIHAHIAICYMTFTVLKHIHYHAGKINKLSPEKIIETLKGVQSTIFAHKETGDHYRVPGRFSNEARAIYKAFDITRSLDAVIY